MARIGMKIHILEGIPLRRDLGNRRKFAVLIPLHCVTVEDVKEFILEEFCVMKSTKLELFIDSHYVLRNEEPVDLILFYSKLDKVFGFLPIPPDSSTSPSPSFLRPIFGVDIDEVDSRASSLIRSPSPSTTRALKRKLECSQNPGLDADHEDGGQGESPPLDSTDKSFLPLRPDDSTIDIQTKENESTGEKMTKSAKRRNRLKRSVAKRFRGDPELPMDDGHLESQDKENKKQDETAPEGEPQEPSTQTTFRVPTLHSPRRVLRSSARKSTPRPSPTLRYESVFVKFEDRKETLDKTSGESSYDPTYYEGLPPAGTIDDIQLQDIVAFQVWEFNTDGPVISKYCEARVIGKTEDILQLEYLKGGPSDDSAKGIDGYIEDNSFAGLGFQAEMSFKQILNTKKLTKASSPPTDI